MVQSKAKTVAEYLAEQPPDRREALIEVREMIRRYLPPGYSEGMMWGMIGYAVPLERYPDTYNGQPLCYAGLAAQKNYNSLYLMGVYAHPEQTRQLEEAFKDAGLRLDKGKSCIHFRRAADLPLEALGRLVAAWPVEEYLRAYEAARAAPRKRAPARKAARKAAKRPPAKPAVRRETARKK